MDASDFTVRYRKRDGRPEVFDAFRAAWLLATPEEIVRQEVLHYLVREKGFARGRIMTEVALRYGTRTLRCDAIYYDAFRSPEIVFEFKAPGIELDEKTMAQAGRYFQIIAPKKLVLSNGHVHYTFSMEARAWQAGIH